MKRSVCVILLALLLIGPSALLSAEDSDPLKAIYSDLQVKLTMAKMEGKAFKMTMADVQVLVQRHYPKEPVKNEEIWDPEQIPTDENNVPIISRHLSIDRVKVKEPRDPKDPPTYAYRVSLRIDFDKKTLTVVNAVYERRDKHGLEVGTAKVVERMALIGDGTYHP